MNKIKNLFVIILFALVAFSCSDILDKGPLDKYSENDVWKSTDLTQAFIYTALANATNGKTIGRIMKLSWKMGGM